MAAGPQESLIPQLAKRLRKARIAAGLSKEFAAVSIGRSWGSIAGYERGSTLPPLDVIEALADLYGVPLADLLGEPLDLDGWVSQHLAAASPVRDEAMRATAAHLRAGAS